MKTFPTFRHRACRIIIVWIFTIGLLSGVVVQPAQAALHYVVNTNDSGAGSLRAAIQASVPGDTIFFNASLSGGTISLASELIIDKTLTINGAALSSKISISGANSVRVLNISSSAYLQLYAVEIRNGSAIFGAGITNAGILNLVAVVLHDNAATNIGGAIYNSGVLSVTNSTFTDNSAGLNGGGIYNLLTATVDRSTFSGNLAPYGGGGMYN